MRIAVLGGGNGSLAAAGDLALAGHEVLLWRRDRAAVDAHRAAGGAIAIKDYRGLVDGKDLMFGVWGEVERPGTIRLGDAVTVIPHGRP